MQLLPHQLVLQLQASDLLLLVPAPSLRVCTQHIKGAAWTSRDLTVHGGFRVGSLLSHNPSVRTRRHETDRSHRTLNLEGAQNEVGMLLSK